MFGDRLPENGASACRLPDPQASGPTLACISPSNDELYVGDEAVCEIGGNLYFPGCLKLAEWLIKTGKAKRVYNGACEMCDGTAQFEYEGHKACDVICLSEVLDEYGLVERVVMEEVS